MQRGHFVWSLCMLGKGAEIGDTTSTLGYDESISRFLKVTGREELACRLIG